MVATYGVWISWRGNGTFGDPGDDVLLRVKPGVVISYGRDQSRALSPTSFGNVGFELINISRDYSPENTSSPLNGFVQPARPFKIDAYHLSSQYILFLGHLDDFKVIPDPKERKITASALDPLSKLREAKATTALYPALRTGEAIGKILDAIGWPAAQRDLDIGATTVRWWAVDDAEAWSSIQDLVAAEGLPSLVTVDTTGKIVFRDRHHRVLRAASITSQATFRDGTTEPMFSAPLEYDQGWRDVYNSVSISVDERDPASALATIWSSDLSYALASGSTYTIVARMNDPFYGAINPVNGVDYQTRSGSATITLSRSSGRSTVITITASGSTVIDSLKIRGYSVSTVRSVLVEQSEPTSIASYGLKAWPGGGDLACLEDAKAVASIVLAYRAERLPTVSMTVIGANDSRLTQCLSRDLSDRIKIIDGETGLNRDFFIEQIRHVIPLGGLFQTTTFGCEAVPLPSDTPFTFDDANNGKFGTGKFGGQTLDDPAGIFIFDHATQGKFGTGKFAT